MAYGWKNRDIRKYLRKKFVKGHINIDKKKLKLPMAYVSIFSNERKAQQGGAFMIWGEEKKDFKQMKEAESFLAYIEIDAVSKDDILNELNKLFINDYTIFPDFEGMKHVIEKRGSLFNVEKGKRKRHYYLFFLFLCIALFSHGYNEDKTALAN
jgi:hypothetical protein